MTDGIVEQEHVDESASMLVRAQWRRDVKRLRSQPELEPVPYRCDEPASAA